MKVEVSLLKPAAGGVESPYLCDVAWDLAGQRNSIAREPEIFYPVHSHDLRQGESMPDATRETA